MKSFYCLIKISPNALSDENLTIGMIMSDENGYRQKFSRSKAQLAKSLLTIDGSLIDFLIKEIEKKINEANSLQAQSKQELFVLDDLLSSEYFSYLSNYSNGILKFSTPAYITKKVSNDDFNKLFRLLVDGRENVTTTNPNISIEKNFYSRVHKNLIEKVIDRVHTNVKLDSNIIPAITSFDVDCIGLNGAFVGAKSLPFTQTKETLVKNVNTYISVIAQLSLSFNKNLQDNDFYLIADEPPKKNTAEGRYWNQLRKNETLLTVIPSEELSQVVEVIEKRNAHKFLDNYKSIEK